MGTPQETQRGAAALAEKASWKPHQSSRSSNWHTGRHPGPRRLDRYGGPVHDPGPPGPVGRIAGHRRAAPNIVFGRLLGLAFSLFLLLGLEPGRLRLAVRLLASTAVPEDRLSLAGAHPLALELDVAPGTVALLLGDPLPAVLDSTERAVRFRVVRHDLDHLRPGLARHRSERTARRPPGQF